MTEEDYKEEIKDLLESHRESIEALKERHNRNAADHLECNRMTMIALGACKYKNEKLNEELKVAESKLLIIEVDGLKKEQILNYEIIELQKQLKEATK